MRIIGLACAFLFLTGCATPLIEHDVTRPDIFAEACEAMEYDCTGIAAPVVVISAVVRGTGNYGFTYNGEPYVFVNPDSHIWSEGAVTIDDVIFHETVHYIHFQTGTYPGTCESEREARVLTAERQGVDYDPAWETYYGCEAAD